MDSNAFSDITTFSFHPAKTITPGEGGALTTNNVKYADIIKLLRVMGLKKFLKNFKLQILHILDTMKINI